MAGFVKGLGKGLGGVVLKPTAGSLSRFRNFSRWLTAPVAILSVPAYTYKGVYKELRKPRGKSVEEFIITARTVDGLEDLHRSTALERDQIVSRWYKVQAELSKVSTHSKRPAQSTPSNSAA